MTSVVIPVYQGAHVLPTTVPAVLALDGVGEVVWVDDGSTDGTAEILREATAALDTHRVVSFPENRGRSAARNAGIAATSGDVLVFFDADVEPPPGAAAALAEAARQPGAVAAVARLDPVITDPDEPYQDYLAHYPRGPAPGHPAGRPLDWRFFLSGACAVRRDALAAVGGFDPTVAYGEDVALACALSQAFPDGLRVADATVRLHDVGDLERALRNARAFGRDAVRLPAPCRDRRLSVLAAVPGMGFVGKAVGGMAQTVIAISKYSIQRKGVRSNLVAATLEGAARG